MTWGLEWRSNSPLGKSQHLIYADCLPVLFRTRADARAYADDKFGYIKTRNDLRAPPHCWLFPRAVRVQVVAA